jgi:hypothetical protein
MFGPIRAVAVDDEPGHLLSIATGLSTIGIPCVGYWYDRNTNELRPAPPEGGLPHVRLLFTDLNLAELGGVPEAQALWSVVVSVLQKIVSKESGPYLLVFWTGVEKKAAEVKEMIYARADQLEGIPCPIDILELPKAPFLAPSPKGQDFDESLREFYARLHASTKHLRTAVAGAVGTDPNLNAVAAWESRAADAAAHAVNEVYRCARADQPDPRRASETLGKVTAKIAIAASGPSSAKSSPARALDAGLIDILVDQFGASVDDQNYESIIQSAIGPLLTTRLRFGNEPQLFAELNTFFHVDREITTAKTWDRGVVVPIRAPIDDRVLGFSPHGILGSEFIFDVNQYDKADRPTIQALIDELGRNPEFVLVEVGAECDHAQNKKRTRRYLLGLELPEKYLRLTAHPTMNHPRHGAVESLGPWWIGGQNVSLLVSCRRYWTWQGNEPPAASQVKYRLRASLVDKLLHHYTVWSRRPGIVEFPLSR